MHYVDIVEGQEYGLRFKLSQSEPLHHVLAVQKVDRNKQVRVRHLEGDHEGMEEFFPFRNLVVLWKARKDFLRNEESLQSMREDAAKVDPVTKDAVQSVFGAAGEHSMFVHSDGHLSALPETVERLAARAGIQGRIKDLDWRAYVDDEGRVHLGFDAAYRLATEFAKREPDTVTMDIEATEEKLRAGGYGLGERWQHEYLRGPNDTPSKCRTMPA